MKKSAGRPHLEAAQIGELTQGTLFTCAHASRYQGIPVHGLAITARCDIAQDKYRILNYIPVVPLENWIKIDGIEILIAAENSELLGKTKDVFKDLNIPISLTTSLSLGSIADNLYPETSTEKSVRNAGKRLRTLHEQIEEFKNQLEGKNPQIWEWMIRNKAKKISELIKKLTKQEVTGFYFLERLNADDNATGYVCLLREVATLTKDVAENIRKGISKDAWIDIYKGSSNALNFSLEDFSMPISRISSPTIEHILQCFSSLFGRIGLPDPVEEEISAIISTLCTYNNNSRG